jgi:hypothetical protein
MEGVETGKTENFKDPRRGRGILAPALECNENREFDEDPPGREGIR